MTKLVLDDVADTYALPTKVNENYALIEAEFEKVLYRDNPIGASNNMEDDIDMNSQSLLNAATISADAIELNGVTITAFPTEGYTGGAFINIGSLPTAP